MAATLVGRVWSQVEVVSMIFIRSQGEELARSKLGCAIEFAGQPTSTTSNVTLSVVEAFDTIGTLQSVKHPLILFSSIIRLLRVEEFGVLAVEEDIFSTINCHCLMKTVVLRLELNGDLIRVYKEVLSPA